MENCASEMEKDIYVATMRGNVDFLRAEAQTDEYLRRKTQEKNNIIHVAIQYNQHDFVEACLRRFPMNNDELICERNSDGNTSFHVAAEIGSLNIVKLLFGFAQEGGEKPWRMQNLEGNTPVHVAIIHDNVEIARFFLEKDLNLAYIVNELKEAPLHLAIKHHANNLASESIMDRVKKPINEGGADLAIKCVLSEDMSSIINYLIEKGSCVTCWPDANGSTPLHTAPLLNAPYNLEVIRSILNNWPQSAEVRDAFGNTILHLLISRISSYQEGKQLFAFKNIYSLRNYQDQQGNTPLHIAARKMDINMVRLLLESSTKLNIKNREGISVASLIEQQELLEMLRKREMTSEECEAADRANITFLRDRMSMLRTYFLLSRDSEGRNVLHRLLHIKNESLIIQEDFIDFIEQVLGSFPALVSQRDNKGDTPVHVLVQNHPNTSIIYVSSGNRNDKRQNNDVVFFTSLWESGLLSVLLALCSQCILKEASIKGTLYISPWLMQNAKGNTPLHEALLKNNPSNELVRRLFQHDERSACLVNKCDETPLHLLAGRSPNMEPFKRDDIESLVKANVKAAFSLDKKGLTPLLRALRAGNLPTATILCTIAPEAAKVADADGQTFWHFLLNYHSGYFLYSLLENPDSRNLVWLRDKYGNTPLHLAIQANRFDIVQEFFEIWECQRNKGPSEGQWLLDLLELQNKACKSPGDLIGEISYLPPAIGRCIENKDELIGIRSMWGIPRKEIKTYVNTMGIIAALLTTITFTAAFTVPGGLHQDNGTSQDDGTPIFIGKTAFQIFMISDVIAMCLSMMVLLCLLWVLATSGRYNSLMLVDFSMLFLLAAFFATLLTFVTGLFAIMLHLKLWIAIATATLCSLLMVLIHRYLVINLFIPFGKATIIYSRMVKRFHTKV